MLCILPTSTYKTLTMLDLAFRFFYVFTANKHVFAVTQKDEGTHDSNKNDAP